ncbi:phenylcoumaran benzylic ether reductase IRL1 [Cryptomeria japonica]|uniref:phenylcoumaran benzylic ether reductase IRL1 n=1 Tax=Cryptomeria japonica TaxID=3369 RepID=UPI0027D9D89F|nr:phenylcoumaran benzylic ether reductase IRL1 [Cryptomeria japonica]
MGGSRILIIGATGYIGRHVANAALAQGHPTFLLVRESTTSNPEKAQLLESFTSKGATLVHGSIDDYASLVEAVKKVDVVISTVGAEQIADQFTLIKAIKAVGTVKRFFPSEFGIDVDRHHAEEPMKSMFDLKVKLRRTIEAESIPYTYVVPNSFAGYFLSNIAQLGLTAPPRDKVVIYGDGTSKSVYSKEEDIGTFTIKAVDDPRTLNKILYLRPPGNTISTNDLVALWESKIGKTLEKVYLSEEQVLKLIQDTPMPGNYMVCIFHTIYVKGDQTNFEIGPDGVEASELYPDVKYTTVEEYLSAFL